MWKEPGFFLAHLLAIAAFAANAPAVACRRPHRQPVRQPVPDLARRAAGAVGQASPIVDGKTQILLMRGRKAPGRGGLFQPGLAGEQSPGRRCASWASANAIASHLISLYCSLAVLTEDALAVLDDVEIDKYHDYPNTYK